MWKKFVFDRTSFNLLVGLLYAALIEGICGAGSLSTIKGFGCIIAINLIVSGIAYYLMATLSFSMDGYKMSEIRLLLVKIISFAVLLTTITTIVGVFLFMFLAKVM